MNSRYKRGWYGESHRHYLASKGIKTTRYMKNKLSEDDWVVVKNHKFRGKNEHTGQVVDLYDEKYAVNFTKPGAKRMSVHLLDEENVEKMPLEDLKEVDYFQYSVERKKEAQKRNEDE